MTGSQPLFDRTARIRNLARADRASGLFLHDRAISGVQERLEEVNRTFTAPAVVGPFAEYWRDQLGLGNAPAVADADVLDLAPKGHDLIIHGLGLHWANDPVGQLIQMRRALRPDGLALALLFGGESLARLRIALAQAEADVAGGLSPRVAPMGEIRELGALLQRAGCALPVADSDRFEVTYTDPFALMRDLRAMGEANAMAGRLRRFTRRAVLLRAMALYTEIAAAPRGRVAADVEIVTLTGWAPGEGQQQPLRPGSAQARLADALGAEERPAGDKVGG